IDHRSLDQNHEAVIYLRWSSCAVWYPFQFSNSLRTSINSFPSQFSPTHPSSFQTQPQVTSPQVFPSIRIASPVPRSFSRSSGIWNFLRGGPNITWNFMSSQFGHRVAFRPSRLAW